MSLSLKQGSKTASSFTLNLDSIPEKNTTYRVSVTPKLDNGTYLDAVTKDIEVIYNPVDTINISCSATSGVEITDKNIAITSAGIYDFTLSYLPSDANVNITDSYTISCDNESIDLKNISKKDDSTLTFRIQVDTMPEEYTSCSIKVLNILENGRIFEETYTLVLKIVPTISISGSSSLVAKNGSCSSNYTFVYDPTDYNVDVLLLNITCANDAITITNKSKTGFTVNVSGITETIETDPTIIASFTVSDSLLTTTRLITTQIHVEYSEVITPFVILNNGDTDTTFTFKMGAVNSSYADNNNFLIYVDEDYTIGDAYIKDYMNLVEPVSLDTTEYGITLQPNEAFIIIGGLYYRPYTTNYLLFVITDKDVTFDGDVYATSRGSKVGAICFHMFDGCTAITTAPILSRDTVYNYDYAYMFQGCTSLKTAPLLPATTLADYCYTYMFNDCTSLETTPELPAETLKTLCYNHMFCGCSTLKSVSTISAKTLATGCCQYMFCICTSLTKAPELPITTLVSSCYSNMFSGCTSLTTVPELPATTLLTYCYSNMFSGCTSITKTPILRAASTVNCAYEQMFYGCTALLKAYFLATSNSGTNSSVVGGTSTGTMYGHISCTTSLFGLPSGWTYKTYPFYIASSFVAKNGTGSITSEDTTAYDDTITIVSVTPIDSTVKATISDDNKTFTLSVDGITEDISTTYTVIYNYNGEDKTLTNSVTAKYMGKLDPFILYNKGDEATVGLRRMYKDVPMTQLYYAVVDNYEEGVDYDDSSVEYSLYENTGTDAVTIAPVPQGSALLLKAVTKARLGTLFNCYTRFVFSSGNFYAYGKIGSLDGYGDVLDDCCYYGMFWDCSSLIKAPELPATTLAVSCYRYMFYSCIYLTQAPELPATTLADYCYDSMFGSCYGNLTEVMSILPATTLANHCYDNMFYNCPKLVQAPELPATTLVSYCYNEMFKYCRSLIYIKALFKTTPSNNYTQNWVQEVASSGTFVKNSAATWSNNTSSSVYYSTPYGWSVTKASS